MSGKIIVILAITLLIYLASATQYAWLIYGFLTLSALMCLPEKPKPVIEVQVALPEPTEPEGPTFEELEDYALGVYGVGTLSRMRNMPNYRNTILNLKPRYLTRYDHDA